MTLLFAAAQVRGGEGFDPVEVRSSKGGTMLKKSAPSYKAPAQKQNSTGVQQLKTQNWLLEGIEVAREW